MVRYYRSTISGLIQAHPGIDPVFLEALNLVEVGEDAKPIIQAPVTDEALKRASQLKSAAPKTTPEPEEED